jgi:hypothetical protein
MVGMVDLSPAILHIQSPSDDGLFLWDYEAGPFAAYPQTFIK